MNGLLVSAVHELVMVQLFQVRSPRRGLKSTRKLAVFLNVADESITALIFR